MIISEMNLTFQDRIWQTGHLRDVISKTGQITA